MTEEEHAKDHAWIAEKRIKEGYWAIQKELVISTVLKTLAAGSVASLITFLWWAFTVFVERGGK